MSLHSISRAWQGSTSSTHQLIRLLRLIVVVAVFVTGLVPFGATAQAQAAVDETRIQGTITWTITGDWQGDSSLCRDLPCTLSSRNTSEGTLYLSLRKDYRGIWVDDGTSKVTAARRDEEVLKTTGCPETTLTLQAAVSNASLNDLITQYLSFNPQGSSAPFEWALQDTPTGIFLHLYPFFVTGTRTDSCNAWMVDSVLTWLIPRPEVVTIGTDAPYEIGFFGKIINGSTATAPTVDFARSIAVDGWQGSISGILKPTGVDSVAFVNSADPALGVQLDRNPNAGGGMRIYPDKQSPTDPIDRRTVTVEATAVPNETVYFRAFDIDDPSTDSMPVDSNGSAGWDNRGALQGKALSATSVQADSNGVARVNFTVTMHPGDNFKIAASLDQAYLNALVVDGIDLKDPEGKKLPTPKAKVTEMLTAWRRFHIERDTMAPVIGNVVTGTITNASNTKTGTTTLTLSAMTRLGASLTTLEDGGGKNRFKGGRLTVKDLGGFSVAANTSNMVTLNVQFPNPKDAVGKTFTLVDDDDYNRDNGPIKHGDEGEVLTGDPVLSEMQESDDPARNRFALAYIMPVDDGAGSPFNSKKDIVFFTNVEEKDFLWSIAPRSPGSPGRNSASNERDDYWVVYLQFVYQGGVNADGDGDYDRKLEPRIDTGFSGFKSIGIAADTASSATDVPIGTEGSWIYLATMSEIPGGVDSTTVPHEVGHQFGLAGDTTPDYGIMSYKNRSGIDPLAFGPEHLNVLRWRVKSPGQQ